MPPGGLRRGDHFAPDQRGAPKENPNRSMEKGAGFMDATSVRDTRQQVLPGGWEAYRAIAFTIAAQSARAPLPAREQEEHHAKRDN